MDAEVALYFVEDRIESAVHGGVDAHDDVLAVVQIAKLHELAPDLQRDRGVRLDPSAPGAVRAGLRQRSFQALPHPLASHLDQPELGDLQDLGLGAVLANLVLQRLEEAGAVVRVLHVDEVENDDPAQVAQANLPYDLPRRL